VCIYIYSLLKWYFCYILKTGMSGQSDYYRKHFYINFPFVDENYVKY